ncbi:MAG: DNA-3-methyladenine glycosylase 2 family protein [Desulfovibrionaceae bacterium]|nr:DNA-3-methyladenine glycosylase 2 family protein [Desulfovibrionaceae bacterium]
MLCCTPEDAAHLRARDKRLAAFMDLAGPLSRDVLTDPFAALVHAVCGQQISSKVHETLWARLKERLSPVTPEHLAAFTVEDLRGLGLSRSKAACIRGAAEAGLSGEIDYAGLDRLDDDAVRAKLCSLKGIGPWSAEMLLIFCLRRPNVLSRGDFGIRRGLRMLYHKKELDDAFIDRCLKRWSPRATIASLYLWELASGNWPGYSDPAKP